RGLAVQDPTARFAGAALRRHVQIRDRSCVYLGCRYPARNADLDHTVDHVDGGATTEANSGPLCRHDHRLKHAGRWRLYQPEPGCFTWISPLGRVYRTQPPPIIDDLPEPRPRPGHPDYPSFANPDDDRPILERPHPSRIRPHLPGHPNLTSHRPFKRVC
ncbi:MAG: HNH endonuclease signature motif containing protein, partial [Pseudonocardiaceae bacterium]